LEGNIFINLVNKADKCSNRLVFQYILRRLLDAIGFWMPFEERHRRVATLLYANWTKQHLSVRERRSDAFEAEYHKVVRVAVMLLSIWTCSVATAFHLQEKARQEMRLP